MLRSMLPILCIYCICLNFFSIEAESNAIDQPNIQVSLLNEENSIQAERPFWVAIRLNLTETWHTYWKNPGDAGMATSVEWDLPKGFSASQVFWPTPERFVVDSIVGYGYQGEVLLLSQITPSQLLNSESADIKANVRWLICSDSFCVPGNSEISVQIPLSNNPPEPNKQWADLFKLTRSQLPQKQQNLQAYRNNDLIELKLQLPNFEKTSLTHFYPEDQGVVGYDTEIILTPSHELSGNYTIALRTSPSFQEKTLKGVLVVLNGQDPSKIIHSIEVDTTIIDTGHGNELISMREQPNFKENDQLSQFPAHSDFSGGLGMALLLAFAGGMILNLMPCVLPVVSIKILSFVKMAGQSRTLTLKHGAMFCFGVLVSFWVLAGILLVFRAYGQEVGWGFQLQEPLFVAVLAAILLIFGLSLFGVFEIGTAVTNWAGQAQGYSKEGLTTSFLSGVLATAVATPCTGPFLGSAIGFAVTVSNFQAMLIFTLLGLGMASPYMVFAIYPNLLRFLPRPGAWMETFKQLMGFLMLATVLWLLWVFGAQMGSLGISLLLGALFCFSIGCWVYGKWGSPVNSSLSRSISLTVALICCLAGGYVLTTATQPWVAALDAAHSEGSHHTSQITDWEEFSIERLNELKLKGTPVLIDFTAKWCLICQANHIVLSSQAVEAKLAELGVVKMKADWTKNNPIITTELRKHGRNGVPLYLLYGSTSTESPVILPQVLTPDIVLQHLADLQ